jgi:hypothetical protein
LAFLGRPSSVNWPRAGRRSLRVRHTDGDSAANDAVWVRRPLNQLWQRLCLGGSARDGLCGGPTTYSWPGGDEQKQPMCRRTPRQARAEPRRNPNPHSMVRRAFDAAKPPQPLGRTRLSYQPHYPLRRTARHSKLTTYAVLGSGDVRSIGGVRRVRGRRARDSALGCALSQTRHAF